MWAVTKHGTKSVLQSSTNTKPVQQQFCNPLLSLSHTHTHTHSETILNCQYYNHPSTNEAPPFPQLPYTPHDSSAQCQVCPASSVMFRGWHLMASLCRSDLNFGLLQLPLGIYFLLLVSKG